MSDPSGTAVPAAIETIETPATAPAKANLEPSGEPSWLPERLAREQRSLLKKAGFETLEDAQAASSALKAQKEAEKSAADKAAEALIRATAAESNASSLRATVIEFANRELNGLTEEQKAAVNAVAGDDPSAQLKAIAALRPTWASAPVQSVSVDTAPPANAPAPVIAGETNHRAQYEALKKNNPFAAAQYAEAYPQAVYDKQG